MNGTISFVNIDVTWYERGEERTASHSGNALMFDLGPDSSVSDFEVRVEAFVDIWDDLPVGVPSEGLGGPRITVPVEFRICSSSWIVRKCQLNRELFIDKFLVVLEWEPTKFSDYILDTLRRSKASTVQGFLVRLVQKAELRE